MNDANPASERGETLILCISIAFVLLACLTIGFDLPRAIAAKIDQERALALARQAEMTPAVGAIAKNSRDPGAVIAAELVRSLRAQGCSDRIEVWFHELPADELPAGKRVYGCEVALRTDLDPVFARVLGVTDANVASSIVLLSMPYAETTAWRPADVRTGVYTAQSAGKSLTFETKTYAELPGPLRAELAQGARQANQQREGSRA